MHDETYTPWDSAELLGDAETRLAYLQAALEENDPEFFGKAIIPMTRATLRPGKETEKPCKPSCA